MRLLPRFGHRLARDARGATVIEFAIVAPLMLILVMGLLELGYNAYVRAILQGSLNEAGRNSTIEGYALETIDAEVEGDVLTIAPGATFTSTRTSYASFSDVGTLEDFTDKKRDGVFDGVRQADECYFDENGSGAFDAKGIDGRGGADDIVAYTMTADYPLLLPMASLLGWSSRNTISATTVLRNQPFGDQASREVGCQL